ncbi:MULTISPECIES: hypothetical protein [unclassified Nostoc]|nr:MULTISPECIES: hypothetical protein [unclassified Nostoc]MBN3885580.1 hypothetical protein [Nostoc sp. JL34]NEU84545.1 hypothetical protein [Nostoc sp. UIC 10630]
MPKINTAIARQELELSLIWNWRCLRRAIRCRHLIKDNGERWGKPFG